MVGGPQTYEYFNKMQQRISSFITNHSSITTERWNELLYRTGELANEVGTVLIGQEAVSNGLIHEVGGIRNAMEKLRELIRLRKGESE